MLGDVSVRWPRFQVLGIVLIGLMALALQAGPGPAGRLAFQVHGRAEGLKHLSITSLAQDGAGFIWAGTEGGAYRYDGAGFRHWTLADGLPSSWVECFCPDTDGSLWIGTRLGLCRFRGGRITIVSEPEALAGAEVKHLFREPEGTLWVSTDKGLFRRGLSGPFQPVPGWAWGKAYWTTEGQEGLWAGAEGGLLLFKDGVWRVFGRESGLSGEPVKAVAEDGAGRLWVRTQTALFMRRAPGQIFSRVDVGPIINTVYEEQLISDGWGGLWVPTVQGLVHLKMDGSVDRLGQERGLPTPWANTALVDRQGGLWASGVGLYQELGRGDWHTYVEADGLPADNLWALHRDQFGILWAATAAGVAKLKPEGFEPVPDTRGEVLYAFAERNGEVWGGGEQPYLDRFRFGRDKAEHVPLPPELSAASVISLAFDGDGALWIGTAKAGLVKRDADGTYTRVKVPGLPLTGEVVAVRIADDGSLWLASDSGLAIRAKDGSWRSWGEGSGLKSARLWSFARMGDGSVWVGYQEPYGLTHLKVEGDRLTVLANLDSSKGLPSDSIYSLGVGAAGNLWAGTNDGVFRIGRDGRITRFRRAEGLVGEDCNPFSFWADPDGDVWIGTTGGLEHHEAELGSGLSAAPAATILSVQADGRTEEGPFEAGARLPDLPQRTGALEFRYATLDYAQNAAARYQVRLLGLGEDWRETALHEARYPALPPGHYRFEVRVAMEDGQIGPSSSLEFDILPPWWRRRAVLSLGVAALLALVWGWLRLRTRRLRRRNEELEELVRQRTGALELSNLALEAISMTDPLTGLGNRRRLEQSLPPELARAQRRHRELLEGKVTQLPPDAKLVAVMLDIDRFKSVNDTYGHAGGDAVLAQVAGRIQGLCRGTDLPARWGGEEFLVVGHVADLEGACAFTERLARELREKPFSLPDGKDLTLTASFGFAVFPFIATDPEAVEWDEVVAMADRCLYAAKYSGRDRWIGVAGADGVTGDEVVSFRWDPDAAVEQGIVQLRMADGTRKLFWG
ncbi:MAG: diguanylate cyclase [Acidobacteria bacterium]|nr:diguanylate cyclase [Acidobacteriota bacterium]